MNQTLPFKISLQRTWWNKYIFFICLKLLQISSVSPSQQVYHAKYAKKECGHGEHLRERKRAPTDLDGVTWHTDAQSSDWLAGWGTRMTCEADVLCLCTRFSTAYIERCSLIYLHVHSWEYIEWWIVHVWSESWSPFLIRLLLCSLQGHKNSPNYSVV